MSDDANRALELLAEGFSVVATEVQHIDAIDSMPTPDGLQRILDEHAAMKDVLGRLREMAPAEERVRLVNLYRDAAVRCHGSFDLPGCPIMPEVRATISEVYEALRRLHVSGDDREVGDLLRAFDLDGGA